MKTREVRRIRRQAANWLAKMQADGFTPQEERKFAAWRAGDWRHEEAFAQMAMAWSAFDVLAQHPCPELAVDYGRFPFPQAGLKRFRLVGLIAAAAAVIVAGIWYVSGRGGGAESGMIAAQGQTVVAALHDGSKVELRAGSEVAAGFTRTERHMRLNRGEAQFSVAKDPHRPFVVEAGTVSVRAVGTAFDVRRDLDTVRVLVTEGKVWVNYASPAQTSKGNVDDESRLVLVAGQAANIPAAGVTTSAPPQIETLSDRRIDRELAWQATTFVFDGTPLSDVVADLNRLPLNRRRTYRLILGDPAVGRIPVSGRIGSDDIASFLSALPAAFGVAVDLRANGDAVLTVAPSDQP